MWVSTVDRMRDGVLPRGMTAAILLPPQEHWRREGVASSDVAHRQLGNGRQRPPSVGWSEPAWSPLQLIVQRRGSGSSTTRGPARPTSSGRPRWQAHRLCAPADGPIPSADDTRQCPEVDEPVGAGTAVGAVAVAGVVEGFQGRGALPQDVEVGVPGGAEERFVPHVIEVCDHPVAPGFT